MVSLSRTALLALVACAAAKPAPAPAVTPGPSPEKVKRATSCTFSGSGGASSASVSQKSCSTIVLSALAVPSGTTLNLSDLEEDTTIIFEGETTWGYEEWDGPLMQIEGTGITITGASGHSLNAQGSLWWDGEGGSGGKTKPKFFYAHSLTDSTISGLYIQNTPIQAISIDGASGLTVTDVTIDNSAGTSLGKNTDGYDIGDSTNVVINGGSVYNQDKYSTSLRISVNSGTSITVENLVCSGGHGLSIGSVGGRTDNTVSDVTFSNCEVKSSVNGVRIKATEGDTGTISGVKYEDILLSEITGYGIIIEQNYDGGDLDGGTPSSGIPITDLTIDNVQGTVESTGYNIVIVCGSGACSDWTWEEVSITGGKTYSSCENVPSVATCS
ncbi:endopolygalacturonase [Xylariales sp. PMI_506]|nr:endopolygalacturonase [Xylariales sp. PMI_506]